MFRSYGRGIAVCCLLGIVTLALLATCQLFPSTQPSATPSVTSPAPAATQTAVSASAAPPTVGSPAAVTSSTETISLATAVRAVTEKVRPAVVQITNEQYQVDQMNRSVAVPAGVGSGVIYDNQGHILTNNHVVAGAQQLLVTLPDGRSFPGKLIGRDPQTDLAVVQVSGQNLPVAELGDSTKLRAGDWVVAIGNALALPGGPTVTAGVVSAIGRTVQEPGSSSTGQGPFLFDVVQTDAAINPGNSGGPLMDLTGKVVGINTLAAVQAEPGVSAQGVGFAISIATAKPIADQLVSSGNVVHAYLPVIYVSMNPAIAAQLGTNVSKGVAIARVLSGGADTGLRVRDVVTQADGKPVDDDSSFAKFIDSHKPGDTVSLTLIRGGQTQTVQVKLAQAPAP